MIQADEPLVYRVRIPGRSHDFSSSLAGQIQIRTSVRALEGMQKEAVVEYGATGPCWRLVCDEGPWLNGTDLAPFPLAFFTAGLASSCLSAFVAEAAERGVNVEQLNFLLDNFFTMEGSALRGTMAAGVQSTEMQFSAAGDATPAVFGDIARAAVAERSPAVRCLTSELPGEFFIQVNDQPVVATGESITTECALDDPVALFESVQPMAEPGEHERIIRKLVDDREPMVTAHRAIGLRPEQKRTVHVRTQGRIRSDGLKVLTVQCIQPVGSAFEFLSDDSAAVDGQERAPSGLALVSCGVAFCFMTQIGRYAQIAKQQLHRYRISQSTGFRLDGDGGPQTLPVRTLVCLDTDEPEKSNRELVRMGEQTCYLHAVYRELTQPNVSFQSHSK